MLFVRPQSYLTTSEGKSAWEEKTIFKSTREEKIEGEKKSRRVKDKVRTHPGIL